jgi:adenylate cyclase class 2
MSEQTSKKTGPREIEVKLSFPSATVDQVMEAFPRHTFGTPIRQVDDVYMRDPSRALTPMPGDQIMRLRTETKDTDTRTQLALKIRQSGSLVAKELEMVIPDPATAEAMILELGFSHCVTVAKTRRLGTFGNYTVCLDEVDGIGVFLELELLADAKADSESVQAAMLAELSKLDLPQNVRGFESYDRLAIKANEAGLSAAA